MIETATGEQERELKVTQEKTEQNDRKEPSNEHAVTRRVVKGQERFSCLENGAVMIPVRL